MLLKQFTIKFIFTFLLSLYTAETKMLTFTDLSTISDNLISINFAEEFLTGSATWVRQFSCWCPPYDWFSTPEIISVRG